MSKPAVSYTNSQRTYLEYGVADGWFNTNTYHHMSTLRNHIFAITIVMCPLVVVLVFNLEYSTCFESACLCMSL